MDKQSIRKMMKEKRLKNKTFLLHNQHILEKVLNHSRYRSSSTIGIYVSLKDEVDTFKIIENALLSHRVCVPKVHGDVMSFYEIKSLEDLQIGHFHVLEPTTNILVEASEIELMIIPMLAFDKRLYRLGYGKGYYDKYMSHDFYGYKLGLAYSWQEVEHVPNDYYDQQLNEIITEKSCIL